MADELQGKKVTFSVPAGTPEQVVEIFILDPSNDLPAGASPNPGTTRKKPAHRIAFLVPPGDEEQVVEVAVVATLPGEGALVSPKDAERVKVEIEVTT